MKGERCYIVLLLLGSATAFAPFSLRVQQFVQTKTVTSLSAKLWDRLQIEEDPEPYWYLINCVATNEIDLLNQCRAVCADMPDAIRFVVPTERHTRSHGAKQIVTETKVKYQGYVFAKLRLCPQVYEAIQALDLCRSWMGTVNHIGHKKLPPAPVALNGLEVENFGLEEYEDDEKEESGDSLLSADMGDDPDAVIVDEGEEKPAYDEEALEVYLGLRVNDLIKVTHACKFYNEDGIVRRLKGGKIFVRFYTYGSMYEEWLEPGHVRKMTDAEASRGLSGPSRPVTQDDIENGPNGRRRDGAFDRPGSLRNTLTKGDRGQRNRRQDRGLRRDSLQEQAANDRNWEWYKDQQNEKKNNVRDDEWSMRAQGEAAPRETPWTPRSARQDRKKENNRGDIDDWSNYVTPAKRPSQSDEQKADEDDFFESLMTDLTKDLKDDNDGNGRSAAAAGATSDEDDFFESLISEIDKDTSGAVKSSKPSAKGTDGSGQDTDDGFFDSLVSSISSMDSGNGASELTGSIGSTSSAEDDFLTSLLSDLDDVAPSPGASKVRALEPSVDSADDDFFASLGAELDQVLDSPSKNDEYDASSTEDFSALSDDNFFVALDTELSSPVGSEGADTGSDGFFADNANTDVKGTKSTRKDSVSEDTPDLSKKTVPILKQMLRDRGLPVSGKKSELIERLQQAA